MDGTPGSSGTLTIPTSGHSFRGTTSYEIVLTATDSDGIQASRSVTIRPQKATLTLATAPTGLTVNVDGVSATAPYAADELIGFRYVRRRPDAAGQQRVLLVVRRRRAVAHRHGAGRRPDRHGDLHDVQTRPAWSRRTASTRAPARR